MTDEPTPNSAANPPPGNNSYERYQRWFNLPVLLGLSLASPTVGAATGLGPAAAAHHPHPAAAPGALGGAPAAAFDPALAAVSNEMHAVSFAAKCLALAHREAANKMLQCGSKFLHAAAEEGAGGQAADALDAFSRVAAAVIYTRWAAWVCRCGLWLRQVNPA